VYPADIPDALPLHSLLKRLLLDLSNLTTLALRAALVAFTWLVLLPLVMFGAWRSYFQYGAPLWVDRALPSDNFLIDRPHNSYRAMLVTGKTPSSSVANVTALANATPANGTEHASPWWQLFYFHLTESETTLSGKPFGETVQANTTVAGQILTAFRPTNFMPSRRTMKTIWKKFTA
jgi:hypothetical protein